MKNKETGQKELKQFECVELLTFPKRLASHQEQFDGEPNKVLFQKPNAWELIKISPVYFWLTEQADAYCAALNSLADLHTASNDELLRS